MSGCLQGESVEYKRAKNHITVSTKEEKRSRTINVKAEKELSSVASSGKRTKWFTCTLSRLPHTFSTGSFIVKIKRKRKDERRKEKRHQRDDGRSVNRNEKPTNCEAVHIVIVSCARALTSSLRYIKKLIKKCGHKFAIRSSDLIFSVQILKNNFIPIACILRVNLNKK